MRCVTPNRAPRVGTIAGTSLVVVFLAATYPLIQLDPGRNLGNLFSFLGRFAVAPNWDYAPKLGPRLWETVLMAFVATFWAILISFPICFFASQRFTSNKILGAGIRGIVAILRAFPELMLALLLASSIGLGPIAGVVALFLTTVGFLVKTFAESLDVVDRTPVEGITAAGADWTGIRTIGAVPQALPDFVGLSLYSFDVNIRASAIIGALGAGGIGYDISQAVKLFQFDRLGLLIVSIYLIVAAIDVASSQIRRRLH